MITGTRLADNLAFHRSVVQNEILKMSARLLEIDRKLNLMRIEEAVAWRRYASFGEDTSTGDEACETVRAILDKRHLKANTAIRVIEEAEIELAALQRPRQAAAAAVEQARKALNLEEALIRKALETDADVARNHAEAEALARHEQRLAGWIKEAPAIIGPLVRSFEADPAFTYLRGRGYGTDAYRGIGPARLLDRWLAGRCSYETAYENYRAALEYEDQTNFWQKECEERRTKLKAEAEDILSSRMAALDGTRGELADALNALDGLDERADGLRIGRSMAMADILQVVLGRDFEYQAMVDTFVRLLAKERAAAMIRIVASPEAGPDAETTAEIDRIVGERIGLSMEADGYRRHISGAEKRNSALEAVVSKLALREWDMAGTTFGLDDRSLLCHDLANGRVDAETAWQEIEASHGGRPEAPPLAA